MSAGAFFRGLAIATDVIFLVVAIALLPRLRRSLRERPPRGVPSLIVVLTLGPVAVFRLIDWLAN